MTVTVGYKKTLRKWNKNMPYFIIFFSLLKSLRIATSVLTPQVQEKNPRESITSIILSFSEVNFKHFSQVQQDTAPKNHAHFLTKNRVFPIPSSQCSPALEDARVGGETLEGQRKRSGCEDLRCENCWE